MESYEHLTTLVTGRIIIEASIGNWKVNLKLKIANILKLLKIPGVQEWMIVIDSSEFSYLKTVLNILKRIFFIISYVFWNSTQYYILFNYEDNL